MITAQSNIITLRDDLSAQLTISASSPQPTTFLVKVKSNMNQAIQVKPSHSILHSHKDISKTKTLAIRYNGKITQANKGKLKINWISISDERINNIDSLKSNQISQLYKQCIMNKQQQQKSLILQLAYQQKRQQSIEQIRFVKNEPNKLIQQNIPPKEQLQQQQQPKEQPEQKEAVAQIKEQHKQAKIQLIFNFRQLIAFAFFSFLLGISFGIKICHLGKEFHLDDIFLLS